MSIIRTSALIVLNMVMWLAIDGIAAYANYKVGKKAMIRNRYNQVPNLTQDTVLESDKNTRKHHIKESQEVSPFPAGDHKAA